MTMADRIVILRDGVIEQVGAPLELYDHPGSQFLAGFIRPPALELLWGGGAPGGLGSHCGVGVRWLSACDLRVWQGGRCRLRLQGRVGPAATGPWCGLRRPKRLLRDS